MHCTNFFKIIELDSDLESVTSVFWTTKSWVRFLKYLKCLEHFELLFLVNISICFSSTVLVSFMQYIKFCLPGFIKTYLPSVLFKSAWPNPSICSVWLPSTFFSVLGLGELLLVSVLYFIMETMAPSVLRVPWNRIDFEILDAWTPFYLGLRRHPMSQTCFLFLDSFCSWEHGNGWFCYPTSFSKE